MGNVWKQGTPIPKKHVFPTFYLIWETTPTKWKRDVINSLGRGSWMTLQCLSLISAYNAAHITIFFWKSTYKTRKSCCCFNELSAILHKPNCSGCTQLLHEN